MDTLPFFRRTIEEAGLEDVVVAVIGQSPTVAAHWATPLGLVFVDGGHAFDVALADYEGWARHLAPGGTLVFHDVFEDPAEGGQAPFRVWQRAVADGFTPVAPPAASASCARLTNMRRSTFRRRDRSVRGHCAEAGSFVGSVDDRHDRRSAVSTSRS